MMKPAPPIKANQKIRFTPNDKIAKGANDFVIGDTNSSLKLLNISSLTIRSDLDLLPLNIVKFLSFTYFGGEPEIRTPIGFLSRSLISNQAHYRSVNSP